MRLIYVYNSALILSLFPWISFGILEGGIQPFYMLLMIVAIFAYILSSERISGGYFLFFLPILFMLFNSFSSEISHFEFLREVVGYFSMAMSFVFFQQYIKLFGFPKKIIQYSIIISLSAGVFQVVIGEQIFEYIVHARTTGGRGVTGFTSEPGFYGMHLSLLVSLLLLSSKEKFFKPILMLFAASGLFLSASIVAAYFYFTFVGAVVILKNKISFKVGLILLSIGFLGFFFILADLRFGEIVSLFLKSGFEGLYNQDSSANARISQILTPFILSYYNDFLPATDSVISQIGVTGEEDGIYNFLSSDNKIGSYIGRMVFHFGFLFLVPLVSFLFYLLLYSSNRQILAIFLIILALLPAISPGYPVVIYFLVYFIHCYPRHTSSVKESKANG